MLHAALDIETKADNTVAIYFASENCLSAANYCLAGNNAVY
jgi:hypothetical protein